MSEIGAAASPTADPATSAHWPAHCAVLLRERFGDSVCAILLYGSFLRGKRDTVLDFYVLLDDYSALSSRCAAIGNRVLPPNVYHLLTTIDGQECAAKYATVTLEQFEQAIRHDTHVYFWARFAQAFAVVYARDAALTARLGDAGREACRRMIAATLGMLPDRFTTAELWQRAFALTYGSELRSENQARIAELDAACQPHLETMTAQLAKEFGLVPCGPQRWSYRSSDRERWRAVWAWRLRRVTGKLLSVLRLAKAAFTFNDPLDYLLWKVERHSGIRVEPTVMQRRHPLLFAWPLLWQLYRQGGFR